MKQLLSDRYKDMFQDEFPIFYKNKIQKSNNKSKFFYRSAIDSALRNNQIRAVDYIIDYIVKYQNNYVSSFLFLKNIPILMEKGVAVTRLFSSQIFCFAFDFDEWPSTHTDSESYMRPYNDSIFDLRASYAKVFSEARFHVDPDLEDGLDSSKFYKVSYTLNMLPQIGEFVVRQPDGFKIFTNKGMSLLEMANDADELEIFEARNFQDVIQFKWDSFAYMIHLRGCLLHLYYVFILILYVNKIYIQNQLESKHVYSVLLVTGIIYPTFYELFQQYKIGPRKYFS